MSILKWPMLLLLSVLTASASVTLNIIEEEPRPALEGRICAYGDFDKDRLTDLLVQRGDSLQILLQSEQGGFELTSTFGNITLESSDTVYCSVGDFDGDTLLDVLVTHVRFLIIKIPGFLD